MAVEALPFTIDNVRAAITSLYSAPSAADIPQINKWLMTFQAQPISWEICATLILETENNVLVVFAGQTLRRKIQHRFGDLQPSMYSGLREALVAGIRAMDYRRNRTGVTQACLALAGMYMKVGTWDNIVGDLFPRLNDTTENTMKFLMLVTLFIQDFRDNVIKTSATRRTRTVLLLQSHADMLVSLAVQMFNATDGDEAACLCVLKAFAAYVAVILSLEEALRSKLMDAAFKYMTAESVSDSVHDAASECIAEVLVKFDEVLNFKEGESTPLGFIFAKVAEFRPFVLEAIRNQETDRLLNFTRVYVELAKVLTLPMVMSVGTNQDAMKPVGWLLEVMEYQDYAILEASGEFWYYFSEVLYQTSQETQNASAFRAFIARLMSLFFRQCRFDDEFKGIPPELVEFQEFRGKVCEIVKDVVFIIGSNKLLEQAFRLMHERQGWENVECALFLMSCVVGNCVSNFADEILDPVVSGIVDLPEEAPMALWYTSVIFVTEISEWFESRPQQLEKTYDFLMRCLSRGQGLAKVACAALTAVSQDCARLLVAHSDDFIATLFASLDAVMPEEIPLELTKSVVAVLMWLPETQRSSKFHEVSSRFCKDLLNVVAHGAQKKLTLHLDRLSMLLLNVSVAIPKDRVHPLQESAVEVYEAVTKTIESNAKSSTVAERGCRALKYLVRSLGAHSLPLLDSLATQMFTFYQTTTHSCFLYLASILVDEFGAEERFVPGFLKMLEVLVPHALQVLNSYPGKKEVANTIEDLYRLGMRFAKRAPLQSFRADFFGPLLLSAVEALKVDDLEALESVVKFLEEVLASITRIGKSQTEDRESIRPTVLVIGRSGEALVNNLVVASINIPPYPWYRRLGAVLFMMKQLYPDAFQGWMNSTYTLLSNRVVNEVEIANLSRVLGEMFAISPLPGGGMPSERENNGKSEEEEQVDLSKVIVRRQWREVEDFSLAQKLQEDEFQRHYSCNRKKRQHMSVDVRLSKQEQLAEECKYRLERLNQEKEDEKLAAQLQQQFDIEDRERRSRLEITDYEYAKSLTADCSSPFLSPRRSASTGYSSTGEFSIISPSDESLNLLEGSVQERSMRLAELSDYELALRCQKEEACAVTSKPQQKMHQRNSEVQNEPAPLRLNRAGQKCWRDKFRFSDRIAKENPSDK